MANFYQARKKTLLFVIAVGILCLLFFGLLLILPKQPKLPPNKLLMDNPSFPTAWDSGEIPVRDIHWQKTNKSNSSTLFSKESSMSVRIWESSNGGVKIDETVLLFDNSIAAYWNFWTQRPEIARLDDWPNFTYGCDNCYFHQWTYKSAYADQEHVVCAMGKEGDCQVFYYWAKYGQYIVQIELFAPNQGADNKTLESIVSEIDKWITLKLNRPN